MMGEIPGSMSSMSNSSSGMTMKMVFTVDFRDTSVLFDGLKASTKPQAFGIFCLIFFVAITLRGLIFAYTYLELISWRGIPDNARLSYNRSVDFGFDDEIQQPFANPKSAIDRYPVNGKELDSTPFISTKRNRLVFLQMFYTTWKDTEKDFVRLILSFLIAMLSYALMLVVMSYVVCYFFAVILGIAVGDVWFKRLERINMCNALIVRSKDMTAPTSQALSYPANMDCKI